METLSVDCGWCECRACDFCVRYAADSHAAWRTVPLESASTHSALRSLSPTAIELAAFRCPPPGGCRFRFRPLNVIGWTQWSLGSDAVVHDRLPPPPADTLRLEVRLLAPFTREKPLLEEVLATDLAKALRAPRTTIHIVELRLASEYATIDLLPPDAFAKAQRFYRLIRSPSSILFSGQATRAIDGAAGLTQILTDGSAAPFAPPDTAEFTTIESLLISVDEAIEQALGLGPSAPEFWRTVGYIGLIACSALCCVVCAASRLQAWCSKPAHRYARSMQLDPDDEDDDEAELMAANYGHAGEPRPQWRRINAPRAGSEEEDGGVAIDDTDEERTRLTETARYGGFGGGRWNGSANERLQAAAHAAGLTVQLAPIAKQEDVITL